LTPNYVSNNIIHGIILFVYIYYKNYINIPLKFNSVVLMLSTIEKIYMGADRINLDSY